MDRPEDPPIEPAWPKAATGQPGGMESAVQNGEFTVGPMASGTWKLSLALTATATAALLAFAPAVAPWYFGSSLVVLGNGALWAWIIKGWLRLGGASKGVMFRAIVAKALTLGLLLALALVMRRLEAHAQFGVVGGLLTPLAGLIGAALVGPRILSRAGV